MKKNTLKSFLAVALLAAAFTSCKDDTPPDNTIIDEDAEYSYVVVARSASAESAGENTIIQTDVITEGEVSLEDGDTYDDYSFAPLASQWLTPSDNDILYNFNYGGNGPNKVGVYTLKTDNKLQRKTGFDVQSGGGTIAGAFELFGKKLVNLFTFIDTDATPKLYVSIYDPATNTRLEKSLTLESILGETPTQVLYFAGISEKDGKFYSSIVAHGDATAPAQIVEFTLSGENITTKLITDDRIAYSGSRMRSLYTGLMDTDDDGNLYVFSSSFEPGTVQPSGALRINKGSSTFDSDYEFNIDAETDGKSVYKVWHLKGDLFLLQTYTGTVKDQGTPDAKRLAIADMKKKTVTFVTGLPDPGKIINLGIGNSIAIDGTKAYVAVNTSDQKPSVYIIDGTTATATRGLVVDAGRAIAVAKLKKNK
ncbi:DUF4374 domain-containing protein [Parapedobacter sp. SGR-10]|uniref:DUF4374 domain-containing protein n=1 Tax=Parapedobacter sp. SGR-10 TaxID=2710879 RepID=UPI0013D416CB|nr:DUF4374 domain-containing protein [Parapedobacter sp. SGR-10]NGF57516.1 DUF4374 domain-containing protein [Parapedobacter sp. SGR-10]